MSVATDRLDRIEADIAARGDNEWYIAPTPADFMWLLALARGHQATLERLASSARAPRTEEAALVQIEIEQIARDRLREAEDE